MKFINVLQEASLKKIGVNIDIKNDVKKITRIAKKKKKKVEIEKPKTNY